MLTPFKRPERKPTELLLVPMIDIFTVLVAFLLMTAVFSRIVILQIDLPSSSGAAPTEPTFRLEVIVRKDGFDLSDGKQVIATIPKVNDAYDLKALTQKAVDVKREHPEANDASVLSEPRVPYDDLIQTMDALRSAEIPAAEGSASWGKPGAPPTTKMALFSNIALGDAP
jgi:biopolymer transport protein ExbD